MSAGSKAKAVTEFILDGIALLTFTLIVSKLLGFIDPSWAQVMVPGFAVYVLGQVLISLSSFIEFVTD